MTTENQNQFQYREAVGALSYLMVGARHDIAFVVRVVSTDGDIGTKGETNTSLYS